MKLAMEEMKAWVTKQTLVIEAEKSSQDETLATLKALTLTLTLILTPPLTLPLTTPLNVNLDSEEGAPTTLTLTLTLTLIEGGAPPDEGTTTTGTFTDTRGV